MNCESAIKLIPLYFYGELPPEEEDRIEQHLDACATCQQEAEHQRAIAAALDRRVLEPPSALLAECRHGLMQAIYRGEAPAAAPARHSSAWWHFREGFAALPFRLRMPLGATAMIALGFGLAHIPVPGAGGTLDMGMTPDNIISSIRSVRPAPEGAASGEVQIVLDETRRRQVSGRLDDRNIQRLMLAAAHDENNPGVRVDSVEILKSHSDSSEVRSLLLNRVLQDPNPGVRLKALDGLKAFTADPEVRKVLAQVLLQDDNPGVRISAVDALTAHVDENIVGVLQNVVQKEDNTYVRRRCEQALKERNASIGTF